VGRKDPRYAPAAALALDVLAALSARVRDAASALGTTTANLLTFLREDPKFWSELNHLRTRFGQKPLKSPR